MCIVREYIGDHMWGAVYTLIMMTVIMVMMLLTSKLLCFS